MRRSLSLLGLLILSLVPAHGDGPSSRVLVSSTLNGTLHVFDASTLMETHPPVTSKGSSPVRLWVQAIANKTYLFSANHGIQGSVGVFDLDGDVVIELPLSPFASGGQGSVGVTAGLIGGSTPMVFITDTVQALGGCGVPEGSVTAFDASLLTTAGVLRRYSTTPSGGVIPYAVAVDPDRGRVFASNTCHDNLVEFTIGEGGISPYGPRPATWDYALERTGSAATGDGPDAVLFDPAFTRTYVTNIAGDSVSVFGSAIGDGGAPVTTVPLPSAGPIDATLADATGGRRWLITSNGQDDTVSIIDRDLIDTCVSAASAVCQAEVARIYAGVVDGAPEGVAYDPVTNRVFVVNKTIGSPALSVIQLDGEGHGAHIATLPLGILGGEIPDLIAFDVVVQTR